IEQQPRDRQRVGDSARMGETRVGQVQDRGPVARAAAIPRRVRPRRHHPLHFLERADRKSTRLNSSHRTISYAVFCLKKKTKVNRHCPISRQPISHPLRHRLVESLVPIPPAPVVHVPPSADFLPVSTRSASPHTAQLH